MKRTWRMLCVAAVMTAGMTGAGWAQEAAAGEGAAAPARGKVAYLGVATSPVGRTLARQLGLDAGVGLAVDFVDPQSPAAAELRRDDILERLHDQILVNHEQLAALVRRQKPGDEIRLTTVREGKRREVVVRLGEKEVGVRPMEGAPLPPFRLGPPPGRGGVPDPDGRRGGFERWPDGVIERLERSMRDAGLGQDQVEDMMDDLTRELDRAFPGGAPGIRLERWPVPSASDGAWRNRPGRHPKNRTVESSVTTMTGGVTVTVTTDENGGRHLTARGLDGKVVFEGAIDTEEQLGRVPEDIRKQVKSLDEIRSDLERKLDPAASSNEDDGTL